MAVGIESSRRLARPYLPYPAHLTIDAFSANLTVFAQIILAAVFFAFLLALYCLPGLVAHQKKKKNALAILLLNIALGWTFFGWVAALVWAATND